MSKLILYGMNLSPPVRAVQLTLKELDLEYEFKLINLLQREHYSEEFVKMNPLRTVPVLVDNGTWIWDSHAICCYLVDKFAKDDKLYPKDLIKRALVNERLFFEASILFMSLRNISLAYFRHKVVVVPKEKIDNVIEGYKFIEVLLADKPYVAGDHLTIADFCCAATISSLTGILPLNASKSPKTVAWLARIKQLPYYEEANGKGAEEYIGLLANALTEITYK